MGENVTNLDNAKDIDFSVAVEEKSELALHEPGELFTRDYAKKLLAKLNAFGRSAYRRSTRRELARSLA